MRSQAFRIPALLAAASAALLLASCGSNNKGKIVGKWKLVASSTPDADLDDMTKLGMAMTFEFRPDGTMRSGLTAIRPEAKAAAEIASADLTKRLPDVRYELFPGDTVYFTNAKKTFGADEARAKIVIAGETMTFAGDGGTKQFVRLPD